MNRRVRPSGPMSASRNRMLYLPVCPKRSMTQWDRHLLQHNLLHHLRRMNMVNQYNDDLVDPTADSELHLDLGHARQTQQSATLRL